MVTDDDLVRAETLLAILKREHAALISGNLEHLDEAVRAKRDAAAHFEQLARRAAGDPADEARRARLAALAAECQKQNEINGGIVEAGLRHVRTVVSLLRGGRNETGLYSRHGTGTAGDYGSRPLAKA